MIYNKLLKPTRQRNNTKKVFGFDIETYDKNKKFYCASIFGEEQGGVFKKMFFDKDSVRKFLKRPMFKNSIIAATNLAFDFMGTFHLTEDINKFMLQWRGSDLIFAKTHIHDNKFFRNNDLGKRYKNLTFIDTMNYAHLSVKKMGKIISIPKLDSPRCLGRLPDNDEERQELLTYNFRDSEISYNFIKFLFNSFSDLGASPKLTIASTAMSLFKNKYLYDNYWRHDVDSLIELFKGYYGGRCEAFKRGAIHKYKYYDFNSLYPSVMLNEFPNPNTMRITYKNSLDYIDSYEGLSDVSVFCPEMDYPLLPFKTDTKLLFPTGSFRGWYSHIEIREAVKLGYTITQVHKTYYYKETCRPFYDYVTDLYDKRQNYKSEGNPMQEVVKILLNSLYGKFGQKFLNKDNWIPIPESLEELYKIPYTDMIGDYIRVKKDFTEPRNFCIPIWALYVTAYGRLKLYDVIKTSEAVYCDTDSIITKKEYHDSSQLGKLKLEMPIKYGVVVRPKFYGLVDEDNGEYVKIKGLGVRLKYDEFTDFLQNPTKTYDKFMKFKESLRRGYTPNEIQSITKNFGLEDEKRQWLSTFSFRELQESKPLKIHEPKPLIVR